jgi:hypothetical protein
MRLECLNLHTHYVTPPLLVQSATTYPEHEVVFGHGDLVAVRQSSRKKWGRLAVPHQHLEYFKKLASLETSIVPPGSFILIRMVRFQTFLLASAALLPSFAYNVKVVNCDTELATNGKDFINDMLADSKILAGAAFDLFPDDEPPNGKTAEANKNVQPL